MTPNSDHGRATADTTLQNARSFLRIAIPSWRFVGIHLERDAEPETVSREEIQTLFQGELASRARKRKLTEQEERDQSVANRLRQALYPQTGGF